MLAHRLSFIPLWFTAAEIETFDSNAYLFVLKKKNVSNAMMPVTTNDFEIYQTDQTVQTVQTDQTVQTVQTDHTDNTDQTDHADHADQHENIALNSEETPAPTLEGDHVAIHKGGSAPPKPPRLMPKEFVHKIFPPNPITKEHILITKLKPNLANKSLGDELHIEARAIKGVAEHHTCFSPVSLCTYANVVDDNAASAALKAIMSKASTAEEAAVLEKRFNAIQRERFFKTNEYLEPNSFRFSMESECDMSPRYIILRGMSVLKASVADLATHVESCEIEQQGRISILRIQGFNHTIGNLVQSLLYNMHVRADPARKDGLKSIGYYVPHPLESTMIIKIEMREGGDQDIRKFMAKGLTDIATYLDHVASDIESGL